MKNKIEDLRNHLFETIERLKDDEDTIDIDRAKAINEVARTVIASAKVEVDYLEAVGNMRGTGFIPRDASRPALEHDGGRDE